MRIIAYVFLLLITNVTRSQSFVHPGILHSKEDLYRMKRGVANKEEPVYSGYQVFIQNPASLSSYKMQGPMAMVGRNPTVGQGTYDADANAAHQNAVMWAITGDSAHANKAKEIINKWSATLKSITGRDAVLMAGLGPFKMVNAAEILRYTGAGWSDAEIKQTETHFKEVIYPVLKDFSPFANGNWEAAAIKTMMAIAVFCNDRSMFERALRYYVNGHGNGRLTYYVINEYGQIQESGRDQGHTQLGVALLAESCEIAWHQGLNLYGYADNRLLRGFEYVAKFNLGNEVPFTEWLDRTGKYHHTTIARQDRGPLRAVYEHVYNHYVNRMGLPAPYSQQAAEKIRPEGPGKPEADHPGYGTLYFTIPKGIVSLSKVPAPPGALIANGSEKEISLTWVPSIGATTYNLKRSTKKGGPYNIIARNVQEANYSDKQVKAGTVYYYSVSASNAKGESRNGFETAVAAGLPSPWKQQDIGNLQLKGSTAFDGNIYKIEDVGMGIDSVQDEMHFTCITLNGDAEIIARFVPQPSSQFSKMGLMMREGLAPNAAHTSLLIFPRKTDQVEAPNWNVRLLSRKKTGENITVDNIGPALIEPAVSWGRLTGFVWIRLRRKGDVFTGSTSYDGESWTTIGTVTAELKKDLIVGIPVSSGIRNSTTVMFDHVSVKQLPK